MVEPRKPGYQYSSEEARYHNNYHGSLLCRRYVEQQEVALLSYNATFMKFNCRTSMLLFHLENEAWHNNHMAELLEEGKGNDSNKENAAKETHLKTKNTSHRTLEDADPVLDYFDILEYF